MEGQSLDLRELGPAQADFGGPAARRLRRAARAYVGHRLRAWREEHGLSQAQAHEQLSLSGQPSRMHGLEAGDVPWTDEDLRQLSAVFHIEVVELVREALRAADPAMAMDRQREAFVAWATTLSPDDWRSVVHDVERRRSIHQRPLGGGA